jgi:hypothetical protein
LSECADLSDVDDVTLAEVGDLVPTYEELSKVHLVQSLVSRILAEMVFDAYYVGLSEEQTTQFRKVEELLSSLGTPPSHSLISLSISPPPTQSLDINTFFFLFTCLLMHRLLFENPHRIS